jgi:diacylglycerol O-acyltransferase
MTDEQLSHLDIVFLEAETPATPMHTGGVVIFEEQLDFDKVAETIQSRLHLVPRFTQRIVDVPLRLGRPFWVEDPEFDLSFHLRHAALPSPGSDEQLCDYAARLISRPLDRSKPLWELSLVDGLEGNQSALVLKTHHAMVDGISSMDVATALFDFDPNQANPGQPQKHPRRPIPSRQSLMTKALASQARTWLDLGNAVRTAATAPRRVLKTGAQAAGVVASAALSILKPAAPSSLNIRPGLHRRYAFVRSTLQTFKDIKNVAGATVNDVVLTVCADALGKLFRSRGEVTEGRSLKVMVPVSVRGEEGRMALGNDIVAVFPDLPIGKMPPFDRLKLIHEQMADVKESQKALAADYLVNATRWSPATLHALAARVATRARMMNLVITNVPGPQQPLYLAGVKMLEPYAVIPLAASQSLAIGITSYNGGIFFGLSADRDSNPDLRQTARYLDESIKELEKAAAEVSAIEVTPAETDFAVGTDEIAEVGLS